MRKLRPFLLALLMAAPVFSASPAHAGTAADRSPPSAPTGLKVRAVAAGRVDLAWTPSRDNVRVVAYDVVRDGRWAASRSAPSYFDLKVGAARTYRYRVRARDAAGNASAFSNLATATTPSTFSFGAAGDHGANAKTIASLSALNASGVNLYLALGDLDYQEVASPAAWCRFMSSRIPRLGTAFPFQLVAGNHEDDVIGEHAACLPDRLGSTLGAQRRYAAEYYFDYPKVQPMVRVVMISPNLTVGGHRYSYDSGSAQHTWVANVIDAARRAGTPWVVVAMHKNCLSAGGHACSINVDLMNMLIRKRVDLVLQGHVHNYQRSKQLALGSACAGVSSGAYNARCVVDDGSDGRYGKGRGTVIMIIGCFGKDGSGVDSSDPEAAYFARASDTAGGFVKFSVTRSRIGASFVRSRGTFTDSFSIQ